jgi:hypothetical protein
LTAATRRSLDPRRSGAARREIDGERLVREHRLAVIEGEIGVGEMGGRR